MRVLLYLDVLLVIVSRALCVPQTGLISTDGQPRRDRPRRDICSAGDERVRCAVVGAIGTAGAARGRAVKLAVGALTYVPTDDDNTVRLLRPDELATGLISS